MNFLGMYKDKRASMLGESKGLVCALESLMLGTGLVYSGRD
jgi:hypothetical protein